MIAAHVAHPDDADANSAHVVKVSAGADCGRKCFLGEDRGLSCEFHELACRYRSAGFSPQKRPIEISVSNFTVRPLRSGSFCGLKAAFLELQRTDALQGLVETPGGDGDGGAEFLGEDRDLELFDQPAELIDGLALLG